MSARQHLDQSHQTVLFVSHDLGETFVDATLIETYKGWYFDGGYSQSLVEGDHQLLVAYYADLTGARLPAIRAARVLFDSPPSPATTLQIRSTLSAEPAAHAVDLQPQQATRFAWEVAAQIDDSVGGVRAFFDLLDASGKTVARWNLERRVVDKDYAFLAAVVSGGDSTAIDETWRINKAYRYDVVVDQETGFQQATLQDVDGALTYTSGEVLVSDANAGIPVSMRIGSRDHDAVAGSARDLSSAAVSLSWAFLYPVPRVPLDVALSLPDAQ